ncbi:MAG: hypothetical protein QM781_10105 [Chitinophagaceae bacterium]
MGREHYLKIDEPAQHIDEVPVGIYNDLLNSNTGHFHGNPGMVGADILFTDLSAPLIYYNNSGAKRPNKLQHLIIKAFAHEPEADQAFFIPSYSYQPINHRELHPQ